MVDLFTTFGSGDVALEVLDCAFVLVDKFAECFGVMGWDVVIDCLEESIGVLDVSFDSEGDIVGHEVCYRLWICSFWKV